MIPCCVHDRTAEQKPTEKILAVRRGLSDSGQRLPPVCLGARAQPDVVLVIVGSLRVISPDSLIANAFQCAERGSPPFVPWYEARLPLLVPQWASHLSAPTQG